MTRAQRTLTCVALLARLAAAQRAAPLVLGALGAAKANLLRSPLRANMLSGGVIFSGGDALAQRIETAQQRDATIAPRLLPSSSLSPVSASAFDRRRFLSSSCLGAVWSGAFVPNVYGFAEVGHRRRGALSRNRDAARPQTKIIATRVLISPRAWRRKPRMSCSLRAPAPRRPGRRRSNRAALPGPHGDACARQDCGELQRAHAARKLGEYVPASHAGRPGADRRCRVMLRRFRRGVVRVWQVL